MVYTLPIIPELMNEACFACDDIILLKKYSCFYSYGMREMMVIQF